MSLTEEVEQRGAKGVDLAILKKTVDFSVFASAQTAISPEEWLNGPLVVDFREFGKTYGTGGELP